MSWCDKLASTPGVGIKLDRHYVSGHAILDAISPILDTWADGEKQKFVIDKDESFILALTTDNGFHYGIEPTRIHVTFNHRMQPKPISGGPPVLEMLSSPLPYSELLPEVSKRLSEVTLLVPGVKTRTVTRVGVISSTLVANDELPPGIARFIKYISRPWDCLPENYSIHITTELDKTADWSDRCIHLIHKPEDSEQLLTLRFDWQRLFTIGHAITPDSLKEILTTAEKASTKYFEDIAEGNMFDEEIIVSRAT